MSCVYTGATVLLIDYGVVLQGADLYKVNGAIFFKYQLPAFQNEPHDTITHKLRLSYDGIWREREQIVCADITYLEGELR